MKLFGEYLKEHARLIAASVLAAAIFLASFALYGLPLLAVAYPALLCLALAAVFVIRDYAQAKRRHAEFMALTEITAAEEKMLPPARSIDDADYRRIIAFLAESREKISRSAHRRWSDTLDYYTVWVHQIKTPIASMRLTLEGSDSPESRKLSAELGRIERYVEMALVYLRLDSESSDYVIREFELAPFIRRAVKKFAGEFISKRLSLELEPSGVSVVSDEKWLAFVVEQLLSNSLKYTREGSVRIYLAEPKTLCIRDTGIGIAPEDLPRIFDKGYTGLNGRADLRASGLGLYLCRRVCRKLGHEISKLVNCPIGETRGIYTLEFVECLGNCAKAPNVLVNDKLFEKVLPEEADKFVEKISAMDADGSLAPAPFDGEPNAEGDFESPAYKG